MLTANYEYSRSKRENWSLPIEFKLSKKPETFWVILLKFLESTWYFQGPKKENEPHRSSISEVIDPERCAYLNA